MSTFDPTFEVTAMGPGWPRHTSDDFVPSGHTAAQSDNDSQDTAAPSEPIKHAAS